jgi:hypothetical protein
MDEEDLAGELAEYLGESLARLLRGMLAKAPEERSRLTDLGQAVALLQVADRFGVVADVRELADAALGQDAYALVSQAMREVYGVREGGRGDGGRGGGGGAGGGGKGDPRGRGGGGATSGGKGPPGDRGGGKR